MLITLSITSVLGRGQLLYPVDGGQVVLSDPAGTVSVFRADTGAVLVAPTLDGNGNPVGPVATAVSPGVAVYTATVTVPDGTPLDEIKWHGLPTIRGYVKPTVYPNGSSTAGATTAAGLTGGQAAQLTAVAAAVTQLGGAGQLSYTGPVAADGSAQIVQGDDTTLQWTVAKYAGPTLAGATVTFGLVDRCTYDRSPTAAVPLLTVAGSASPAVVADGSTSVTYTVPLTAAQTAQLPSSPVERPLNLVGQIAVVAADGTRRTAVLAAVTVRRRVV